MPLFEIGYRRYEGRRTSPRMRWWPITRGGLIIAWRSKLLRWLVVSAYLPLLYLGLVFFALARITDPSTELPAGFLRGLAESTLGRMLVERLHSDPTAIRTAVWAVIFTGFCSTFQLMLAALVAAVAGPPAISQDLRSRAFLLYFSRPVSSTDYLLGKAGTLAVLIGMVTLVPSLLAYLLSIAFSPSLETVRHTAPVLIDLVLSSVYVIVPTTLVVLLFSSLTKQARFATAAWAILLSFGVMFHHAIGAARNMNQADWPRLLSLAETVREAQLAVFDLGGRMAAVPGLGLTSVPRAFAVGPGGAQAQLFLAGLSLVCVLLLLRRVGAPTRI